MKKTQRKSKTKVKAVKHSPQTSRNSKIAFIVAGAVLLLIIMAAFAIYLLRDKSQENVAAVVNGKAISNEMLNFQYGLLPESYREAFSKDQVLEQIIDEELIVQVASREGINATPEDVNERVQRIMAQNELSATDLQNNLNDLNVTLEQFEQLIARQYIIDQYLNKTLQQAEVSDATLEGLYNASKSRYVQGEQVTVRHVLISNQRPEAAVAAKRIHDAAKNGSDFCQLVQNASDDRGSRASCGQYTFPRNFMVPEFEAASFEMNNGEVRMVQTQFGYHVIKKMNSTPEGFKPFSEVREELLQEYLAADRSQQYRKIVSSLRSRATITYANGTTIVPQQPPSVGIVEELNQTPVVLANNTKPAVANVTANVTNVTANVAANGTGRVNMTNATKPANTTKPINVTANATANITKPANATLNVTANVTANVTNRTVSNVTAANVTTATRENVTANITANVSANKTVSLNATANTTANVTAQLNTTKPNVTKPVNTTQPYVPSQPTPAPDTKSLLGCIAGKSTLYGTSWSSDTQDARALFGQANVPLKYVECDTQANACTGIVAYPTWSISGKEYLGRMTLEQLKAASDCK